MLEVTPSCLHQLESSVLASDCLFQESDKDTCLAPKSVPGGSDSKVVCLQCERPGFDPWVGKIAWRRKWQPTSVLLPWKSHGWRSLVQATVHEVGKSWARLSNFTFFLSLYLGVKSNLKSSHSFYLWWECSWEKEKEVGDTLWSLSQLDLWVIG